MVLKLKKLSKELNEEYGKGIVIIDKENYTEANFLHCSYELNVTELRSQYPTQKLKALYITISDDNTPYYIFYIFQIFFKNSF